MKYILALLILFGGLSALADVQSNTDGKASMSNIFDELPSPMQTQAPSATNEPTSVEPHKPTPEEVKNFVEHHLIPGAAPTSAPESPTHPNSTSNFPQPIIYPAQPIGPAFPNVPGAPPINMGGSNSGWIMPSGQLLINY